MIHFVVPLKLTEHCKSTVFQLKKENKQGFSGVSVVKNLPANAGDGSALWSRMIPHASGQLSPCTTATEPAL